MNTANHKPVSESARLPDEKTSTCKAFVGMKLSSDSLLYPLYLSVKCLVMSSGAQVNCMFDTASAVLNNSKSKDGRKMKC